MEDDFEKIKSRIREDLQYGDIKKACDRENVSTAVYNRAVKKKSISELTGGEFRVITALIGVFDERRSALAGLESYAK